MSLVCDYMLNHLIKNANSVGIVSHDAGGANILNALTKRYENTQFDLLLGGPAVTLFGSYNVNIIDDFHHFFSKNDLIIFGTGSSSFEKKFLEEAKDHNCTTATVLDHFVNYRDRFIYKNELILPDYCFVCDQYSLELAVKELAPYNNIYICENYLVSYIKSKMGVGAASKSESVLYVLEDIKEEWNAGFITWEIAFNYFYNNFYTPNKFKKIIVRPHPNDNPSIYESLNSYKEIMFDYDTSPVESFNSVSVVVGIESYLMYIAHYCGLNVYTSLPSSIRAPRLPSSTYKRFR